MHSTLTQLRRNQGFTLIEVMIALFILVIIGVATSKAVVDAARLKENLKSDTEFSSEFRTSVSLIERDLNQVFNPRWFLDPDAKPMDPFAQPTNPNAPSTGNAPPQLTAAEINQRLRGQAFQAFEFWGPVYDPSGLRPSRFKGNDQSMSFVTASHVRIYKEKRESIYSKVRYELVKQAPNPNLTKQQNEKIAGLYSLVKIENTRAFELEEPKDVPYVQTYVILNYIKNFKFHYYKRGEKNPTPSWDSELLDTKGMFPEAVEVELTLISLEDRILDAKILFKLEAPNEVLPITY